MTTHIHTTTNKKPPPFSGPGKQWDSYLEVQIPKKKSRPSGANETKIMFFLDVSANFRKTIQHFLSGKQGVLFYGGLLFEILLIMAIFSFCQ